MLGTRKNETLDVSTSKIGKVFTSKFVGTGPSSYKKRIYRAAVLQRLRNTGIDQLCQRPQRRNSQQTRSALRTQFANSALRVATVATVTTGTVEEATWAEKERDLEVARLET